MMYCARIAMLSRFPNHQGNIIPIIAGVRMTIKQSIDQGPEAASKYSWKINFICLLPTLTMLLTMRVFIGSDTETSLFFTAYRTTNTTLTIFIQTFTDWGNAVLYGFYGYLLLLGKYKNKPDLFYLAGACLIAHLLIVVAINPFIKAAIGRPRPFDPGPLVHFAFDSLHVSFPSGHTTAMAGLVLPLAQRFGRHWLSIIVLGLPLTVMGFTRVYLNMHYPTDILGGLLMGSLLSCLAWRLIPAMHSSMFAFLLNSATGDVAQPQDQKSGQAANRDHYSHREGRPVVNDAGD
ncbi:hypothetical protein C4J81_14155 [Deltaproteobacteria bacterium Smac51]|nr:hypothetical protein C4J81_14155 [Deltaproteobacteria bacterium Smac51]